MAETVCDLIAEEAGLLHPGVRVRDVGQPDDGAARAPGGVDDGNEQCGRGARRDEHDDVPAAGEVRVDREVGRRERVHERRHAAGLVLGPGGEHADDAGKVVAGPDDAEVRGRRSGARFGHCFQDLGDAKATGQAAPSFLE